MAWNVAGGFDKHNQPQKACLSRNQTPNGRLGEAALPEQLHKIQLQLGGKLSQAAIGSRQARQNPGG
ncbi:MAG TPA: hypothetical protein VNZ22_15305, partial [Bacillota bacterium]|nr:hypothetical protein [Bacillota bacterium]